MTMPVLPATSSSPTPVDSPARINDTGTPTEASAFSNVLSGQRGTSSSSDTKSGLQARETTSPDTKKHESLGPDEALALILDAAALPLMQAPAGTVVNRHSANSNLIDATVSPLMQQRQQALTGHTAPTVNLLADDAAADTDTQPAANSRSVLAQGFLSSLLPRNQAPTNLQLRTGSNAAQANEPTRLLVAQSSSQSAASLTGDTKDMRALLANGRHTTENTKLNPTAGLILQAAKDTPSNTAADTIIQTAARLTTTSTSHSSSSDALTTSAQSGLLGSTAPLISTNSMASSQPLQINVPTPFNSPQWPQDVSRQLFNLTQAGVGNHTVMMHVNPPELGPVQITLHLGDSMQALFVSPHANVRQALENALPHLQQQLAQSGLSLGQANVSDQQPGQQQFAQGSAHSDDGTTFSLDDSTDAALASLGTAAPAQRIIRPNALVDTFA